MPKHLKKLDYLYRNSVGIMILNKNNLIFSGKRINDNNSWQMPQGGIEIGEDEDIAMYRELKEETGIENVEIIHKSSKYYYYNLPYFLQKKLWRGKYIGQKQRWYLVKYIGKDNDININGFHPEFSDWRWVNSQTLIERIIYFKKELYTGLIKDFSKIIQFNN